MLLALCSALGTAHAAAFGPWPADLAPPDEEGPVEVEDSGLADSLRCDPRTLTDGVQLPDLPELYVRWHPDRSWGTPELIDTITQAAAEVAWLLPDADPIVVGDMSSKGGGYLPGHKSHRGGIDADIGLFVKGSRPHENNLVRTRPAELDAPATWLLIRAFLGTGMVERIFLDQRLINTLERYAVSSGQLTQQEADRIFPQSDPWALNGVVQHMPGHDSHMHVRIFCPAN